MSDTPSKSPTPPVSPPACPACHATEPITLENMPREGAATWRCGVCGARWDVMLTPRTER